MENYYTMYNKFIKGEITVAEWNLYCMKILNELMTKNKKILENLKNA